MAEERVMRCSRCKEVKSLDLFNRNRHSKTGYQNQCRLCTIEGKRNYYLRNPWMITLYSIRNRCTNRNHSSYGRYGGVGITSVLSASDLKFLWDRDKAQYMSNPSIDRIDPALGYSLANCRYIEMADNLARREF